MDTISFREIANFMDPIRPPDRLRGSEQHDYNRSDESQWHQGGASAKRYAADFGLYHAKNKGLFQVHQGNPNSFRAIGERHIGTESQRHKILVYNTYLMNAKGFKEAEDREARSMDIGRMIGREGYDIVCLCEVFDSDDGDRIRKQVDNYGSRRWAEAFGPDSSWYHVSGGLYGLIKEQRHRRLTNYKNKKYSDGGEGADEWANKGWLLMELDLGPGILDIFLTHTNAGADNNNIESREEQLRELIPVIKKRQDKHPDHITMAVGDFNVYSSKPEYKWLLEVMKNNCSMRDIWLTRGGKASATNDSKSNCTISGPPDCACEDYNSGDYGGDRLDYIFLQDPKPEHTMNLDLSRVRRKPFPRCKPCGDLDPKSLDIDHMSDHLGLHLEFLSSPK